MLDREARVDLQEKLLKKFKAPLLFMRVNYPGLNKDNLLTNNIIQDMDSIVTDIFSAQLKFRLFKTTAEGPNVTMIIEKDAVELKKTAMLIEENHTLGRCIDIDIYDNNTGEAISRRDMGIEPRRCYICSELAVNCVRSQKHGEAQIIRFIQDKYKEFMESFYGKRL